MARKTNAKPKSKVVDDNGTMLYSPSVEVQSEIRELQRKSAVAPNIYADIVQSLFEKNRKRVSTYYCPSVSCRETFWNAEEGYTCPACGTLGIISEFKYSSITNDTRDRNILGYVDTVGRLVCSSCILKYGVQTEIGLIVYDDTDPFCFETCELCREPLGQLPD